MSDSEQSAEEVELTEEQMEEQAQLLNAKILEVFLKYDPGHTDNMKSEHFKNAMEEIGDPLNDKQGY